MKRLLGGIVLVSFIVLAYLALRPVCVPLTAEDLAGFTVPPAQRTERDFYVRIFQLRDGRWHQCKTWLSRQLFF